ncbi:SRPBCC family protein [Kribbella sp. NPDC020789]
MSAIVSQVEVDAPQTQVFDYVTDPTRFSEWQANVTSGRMDDPKGTAVGSRCATTRRIGGRERDVTAEVTKYSPPSAWGVRGIDGPIRSVVDVTVEPLGDAERSRVTISIDFTGHGIGKVLVPLLVKPQAREEMRRNMARLKERLESA